MSKTSIALNDDELQIVKRFAAAANQTQSEFIRSCIFKRIKQPAADPAPAAAAEIKALSDGVRALAQEQAATARQLAQAIKESARAITFREYRARANAENWALIKDDPTDDLIELARGYHQQYCKWPDPANKREFGNAEGIDLNKFRASIRA